MSDFLYRSYAREEQPKPPEPTAGPAASLVLGAVLVGGMVWFASNGQMTTLHSGRIAATLLPPMLGLVIGINLARKKRALACLAWSVVGIAAGVLSWWFVPTGQGASYWSATRSVDEIEARPATDLDQYFARQREQREVLKQFPSLKPRIEMAEQNQLRNLVKEAIAGSTSLLATDPARAWSELLALSGRLEKDRWYRLVQQPLAEARQTAMNSAATKEVEALLAAEKFQETTAAIERFEAKFSEESRLAGQRVKFPELRTRLQEAEQQWLTRQVNTAIERADKLLSTKPGRASLDLRKLAQNVAANRWYSALAEEPLRAARQRAAGAILQAGKQKCKALVAADQIKEAAALAEQIAKEMEPEALFVGLGGALKEFREGYGFLGDLARQAEKPMPK